ncbi:MAG: hypothetical protein Q4D48_07035 [Coriobacteriales bacterium]|nr:hypothetical protein [Coriobacteriales bacterium]
MKLPEHERAAHREAFRAMSIPQKAEYIFAYYKLPLVLLLIAIVALGSVAKYFLTYKNAVLYAAYANVTLTDEQDSDLFDGFLDSIGVNQRKNEVYRYRDLYLVEVDDTVDHQYSYASRIKTLAAIDAEELDIVLMSKAAYDLLSNSGYLMDLEKVISDNPSLLPVRADLVQNVVVLEDNRVEVELNEADTYEAVTEDAFNALDVTEVLTSENDLTGTVYLGIIGNSPRLDAVVSFITYLYSL